MRKSTRLWWTATNEKNQHTHTQKMERKRIYRGVCMGRPAFLLFFLLHIKTIKIGKFTCHKWMARRRHHGLWAHTKCCCVIVIQHTAFCALLMRFISRLRPCNQTTVIRTIMKPRWIMAYKMLRLPHTPMPFCRLFRL